MFCPSCFQIHSFPCRSHLMALPASALVSSARERSPQQTFSSLMESASSRLSPRWLPAALSETLPLTLPSRPVSCQLSSLIPSLPRARLPACWPAFCPSRSPALGLTSQPLCSLPPPVSTAACPSSGSPFKCHFPHEVLPACSKAVCHLHPHRSLVPRPVVLSSKRLARSEMILLV